MFAKRIFACSLFFLVLPSIALAEAPVLPQGFETRMVTSPAGAEIFVRSGGAGPAVILIHGYGDTGDMWGPLATDLATTHTVLIPDLRGMGGSSQPAGGYDKKTQAADIRAVVTAYGFDETQVVAHDIGLMVAYAYASEYPDKVEKLVMMDAPVPGVGPWDQILRDPRLWHFGFGGIDAERLVEGRERIFLDRIWNDFAGDPSKVDEETRVHYAAIYAEPGAMHASLLQLNAIPLQDVQDNLVYQKTALKMPVLAIGGERSFGTTMTAIMEAVATDVTGQVIPDAGHWLMEESPQLTVDAITDFLR